MYTFFIMIFIPLSFTFWPVFWPESGSPATWELNPNTPSFASHPFFPASTVLQEVVSLLISPGLQAEATAILASVTKILHKHPLIFRTPNPWQSLSCRAGLCRWVFAWNHCMPREHQRACMRGEARLLLIVFVGNCWHSQMPPKISHFGLYWPKHKDCLLLVPSLHLAQREG